MEQLAQNVLKHYMETDPATFEQCAAAYEADQAPESHKSVDAKDRWASLDAMYPDVASTTTGAGAGASA